MEERGSAAHALAEILTRSGRFTAKEMENLAEAAGQAGGGLVAVDVDGDWCGTGRFRFKWPPPKPKEFSTLLDRFVKDRIHFAVLINGIPWPDELLIDVSRRMRAGP